ncbi:MAG TPA: polysaccharide deacetylase family protein, partial [Sphingomicrobium sp.]|nr:polysaccharide deacetylase family protein [Sphingomicrobium sp.]
QSDYLADLECTTSPKNFRRHIDYLIRHYTIVPLEMLLSGNAPRKAVSLTFDDGYASVYDNVFPLLKERQLSATIYLISSVVDNRALVWVNELNYLTRQCGETAVARARRYFDVPITAKPADIITICRLQYSRTKIEALLAALRKFAELPEAKHAQDANLYLSWAQIDEMRRSGVEFGNHSRTHPNMELLTEEEQLAEISSAQKELQVHLPVVRAFAHPFGHRGSTTASLASKLGLKSAADVGGYNHPIDPLSLGRTHMTNESVAGLFARMEVVEPLKGLLRKRLRPPKNQATAETVQALA